MDPAVASELEAIDRAVRGEGVDGELDRLAFGLRAERPVPEREFAARLDALVREGFRPVAPEPSAKRPRQVPRPRLALAVGAVATLFIGVTAVLSSGVLDRESQTAGLPLPQPAERQSTDAAESAPPAAGGSADSALSAPSTAAPPQPVQGIAPGARSREVERQASLTLAPPRGEVESVADEVIGITDRYRGIVLSSRVSGGSEGRERANLELRIPARRLQPAIADLSELAHVRSRTQSSEDVTAAVASTRDRLRDALSERRSLLTRLEQAATENEAAALRTRLRTVNRRIARIRATFRAQRNRVGYAAVAVAVQADGGSADRGDWTPGDALDDARGILGTSVAVALVTVAVLLPVMLLALFGLAGWRQARKRLRDRALDRPAD